MIEKKDKSQSKRFASLPTLAAEWASEFDIRVKRSSAESRQFMSGSELNPVSTEKI